ncbi:MAG: IspD/TarI family cytidylyltransferase [Clostridia bacterium]|nr:IspD/TarI family cytidylyltransferase [Clostridia bacterium]
MNIAVIFAGGVGSRMHSKDKPKQFLDIYNKPVIIHTIEHFENCEEIDAVVVACVADWIPHMEALVAKWHLTKVRAVVPGGETGQLSIYNGLIAAKAVAGEERSVVLIHDGVRPLITGELIRRNIADVRRYGTSITTGIVKETITAVDDAGNLVTVHDRAHSRVAKAPQCFWLDEILAVQEKAIANGETAHIDSCTLMHTYGHVLHMTDGPYENIKITTPDDYYTMRAILAAREDAQIYCPGEEGF